MCFKTDVFWFSYIYNFFCKIACKCWLGHGKTTFAMANFHFAMEKHLTMAEVYIF